jgi:hypothetical protein
MSQASLVQEHMDVISSDRKTVGKVDHLDGPDKIKLTKTKLTYRRASPLHPALVESTMSISTFI